MSLCSGEFPVFIEETGDGCAIFLVARFDMYRRFVQVEQFSNTE